MTLAAGDNEVEPFFFVLISWSSTNLPEESTADLLSICLRNLAALFGIEGFTPGSHFVSFKIVVTFVSVSYSACASHRPESNLTLTFAITTTSLFYYLQTQNCVLSYPISITTPFQNFLYTKLPQSLPEQDHGEGIKAAVLQKAFAQSQALPFLLAAEG